MADFRQRVLGTPFHVANPGTAPVTFSIAASNSSYEVAFLAPEAITITQLGFRYGLRTGTPPTYQVSLQGVTNATGRASGTVLGGGSPALATFTPPADATWDSTWRWITLANAYTCARGDLLAFVISYSSGTVSGAANSSFVSRQSQPPSTFTDPSCVEVTAGTAAFIGRAPVFGYASATKAYGHPFLNVYAQAFNSGSSPNEYAMRFVVGPVGGGTYQVDGARVNWIQAANHDMGLTLYDGTTALQTVTLRGAVPTGATVMNGNVYFSTGTLATLAQGAVYRLGVAPSDATGITLNGLQVTAAADMAAYPDGTDFFLSTRTGAGAWTDDATTRPFIFPIVTDLTGPAPGIIMGT